MTTLHSRPETGVAPVPEEDQQLKIGAYIVTFSGLVWIVFGIIFFVHAFSDSYLEIGIGPHEVSRNKDEIQAFSPSLYEYIKHLHVALAGFSIGIGMWVAGLAWFGIRRAVFFAWHMAVWPPLVAILISFPMHYPNHFDTFKHLGILYIAIGVFAVGALLSLKALITKYHKGTTTKTV